MIKRFFYWVMGEHLHQWSKWEKVRVFVTYVDKESKPVSTGYEDSQKRKCKTCDLIERRDLDIPE